MPASLIFLHGGPGYADYMERFFVGRFPGEIECAFYTQRQKHLTGVEDLILELADHVNAQGDSVYLAGHSWGGALATEYLRRTNDSRIRGLILFGSFLCGADVTTEYRKELADLGLESPSLEQIFLRPEEAKIAGNFIPDLNRTFNLDVFNKLWPEFVVNFDARDFIRNIRIPVLNIFGEKDVRVPARRIRAYGELSPRVENFEIADAGHFPFFLPRNRDRIVEKILASIAE
jgi:pimeloyl-ACP methyl ester carboxylesterase